MPRPSYAQSPAITVEEVKAEPVRKERLALNLFDAMAVHPTIRANTTKGRVSFDKDDVIWVDRSKQDETACPFTCPLIEAAMICDLLRAESKKVGERPVRVYINRGKAWVKLPQSAILTKVKEGKTILNPEWFPPEVELHNFDVPDFEIPTFGS